MKFFPLILTLFFGFSPPVSAESEQPQATINVGIYYTFKPTYTFIQQNGRNTEIVEFENSAEFENGVKDLIKNTETLVNSFFSRKIIGLEIAFLEYWEIKNMPLYREPEKFRDAVNIDKVFEIMDGGSALPQADIYLILFELPIAHTISETTNKTEIEHLDGKLNVWEGNKIALSTFYNPKAPLQALTLLHELGHYLGLKHTPAEVCEQIMHVMCSPNQNASEIAVDKQLPAAFLDYYNKHKNQN
ncbi:MAG: hypothetical protein Q8P07_06095 [bacterium]|nr:hypothetical protein [bacterium]